MSTNAGRFGPGRKDAAFEREPARRVFASELRECRYQFKDGEDEKSPTFVLLPTGERCNRIFIVGTLTEKTAAGRAEYLLPGPGRRSDRDVLRHGRELPARGDAAAGKDRDAGICRGHRQAQHLPERRGKCAPRLGPRRVDQCCGQGDPGPLDARHCRPHARPDRCTRNR